MITAKSAPTAPELDQLFPDFSHSRDLLQPLPPTCSWGSDTLTWSDSTLVWLRNDLVYRKASYEDAETIRCATFANLAIEQHQRDIAGRNHTKRRQASSTGAFGSFHGPPVFNWGSGRPSPSSGPHTQYTHLGKGKEADVGSANAVVVFLKSKAHVHLHDGENYTMALPYEIDSCYGLREGGVIVQLLTEAINSDGGEGSNRLWALHDPIKGLLPVRQFEDDCRAPTTWGDILLAHESNLTLFHDSATGVITFARRTRATSSLPSSTGKRTLPRASEVADQPHSRLRAGSRRSLAQPRQSLVPDASAHMPTTKPISQNSKVGPRVSVLEPISPTLALDKVTRASGLGSLGPGREDMGKMLREDANDGMSENRRSSALGVGKTMPARWKDEFGDRDITMFMGLEEEEEEEVSELGLKKVGEWREPLGAGKSEAYATGSATLPLIHVLTNGHLLTFTVRKSSADNGWTISTPTTTPALAVTPVKFMNPTMNDLLILATHGDLHLWTPQLSLPITLPGTERLAGIKGNADGTFIVIPQTANQSFVKRLSRYDLRFGPDQSMPRMVIGTILPHLQPTVAARFIEGIIRRTLTASWSEAVRDGLSDLFDHEACGCTSSTSLSDPIARMMLRKSHHPCALEAREMSNPDKAQIGLLMPLLNLVTQDLRLASDNDLVLLATTLSGICIRSGYAGWAQQIAQAGGLSHSVLGQAPPNVAKSEPLPDLLDYLSLRLRYKLKPFPTIDFCERTKHVLTIYERLSVAGNAEKDVVSRSLAAVSYLAKHNLSSSWVSELMPEVALPILEAMRVCQLAPRGSDAILLERVGRRDLAQQARSAETTSPAKLIRFGTDRRIEEVDRIMQTTSIRKMEFETPHGADVAVYQQTMVNNISRRTLATTIGNGIYHLGTQKVDMTQAINIPTVEVSVKVGTTIVKAHVSAEQVEWPCFHNGVASAFSIYGQVDNSWVMFCKPAELGPEYGGFLLGLGLRGHLTTLRTFDAYALLEARHDFTTTGLLLGLAGSYVGSKDALITKALSLHTLAYLPMGSADLNASQGVRSAAMLGIGLVHAASGNLSMAQTAASEIKGDEAYAFSSAMSLGLIMLRKAVVPDPNGKIMSTQDRAILSKLTDLFTSPIYGPSAITATGLMYLKSNSTSIRDMIVIPESMAALDYLAPESLLFRVYARSLVMWNQISPSVEWITAQLPSYIDIDTVTKAPLTITCAYVHIVSGACMALGVKYAGTASEAALYSILRIHSLLNRFASSNDNSYEGKIRRRAARQGIDVMLIAMCSVMSGTGEIGVLRRLRIAHGQEGAGVNYGTHTALHMALGLLFLGKGYYTLGTSDLAIAAMTIAFFPRFSQSPEHSAAYPPAFRHLWALAVEPRCIVARDVDTGKVENVPIKVKLRVGNEIREQKLMSPTLISPFDDIVSIEIDSVRYWPVKYDMTKPKHRQAMVANRTIHVQRRLAFLDYNTDNKGTRSVHARVGSLTGFDMHHDLISPAAPPSPSFAIVAEVLRQHSTDPLMHGYGEVFSGDSDFERFTRSVLLECLVLDKPSAVALYQNLYLSHTGGKGDRAALERILTFYKNWPEHYAVHGREKTLPLIRLPFLGALAGLGQDKAATSIADTLGELDSDLRSALQERIAASLRSGDSVDAVTVRVFDAVRAYDKAQAAEWKMDDPQSKMIRIKSQNRRICSLEDVRVWVDSFGGA